MLIRPDGSLLLAVLALTLSGSPDCRAQQVAGRDPAPPKRILLLSSQTRDLAGSVNLEQAVRAEMREHCTNRLEFLTENLDSIHFSDQVHFRLFQDYLGKKYAGQKLDLILAFSSRDYRLAVDLPELLFPKVPVVFVAVNELEVPPWVSGAGVTGIVQRFDIRGTLGLIMRLQPDTRRVVVIGGTSEADRAALGRIAETGQSVEGIALDFWTNQPVAELPATVSSLPKGTVILLATIQTDVTGQHFFTSQIAELLAPPASVPVYVLAGYAIGSGALGGVVVDPEELGARVGKLARRVLEGAGNKALPIEVATQGTPMVDWRALKRWSLRENRLPAETVVRYQPENVWERHRSLILISLALILAQSFTIGGLLAQRRQRRRAEAEMLDQRMELAHAARVSTMGQLASALAHELNQPLGAILRNTEAAEMFLQNEKPDWEEIRSILADIREDDKRAGNVISRMRSLLQRRSLELKSLDLGQLLAETVSLAQSDARTRKVSLTLQLPARLPAVRGDRVHLQQVLLNLILNGMDAMADGIKTGRLVEVRAIPAADGSIEVSVTDNGAGIPTDKLQNLFAPFFTTKPEGLGMGLAISQTIIEAHGGKIWGGNHAPRGAVFKFTLLADQNNL
jgi:signal transduction histidine kinase